MQVTNGFQLLDGDLALLQHAHVLRLATIEDLVSHSGRPYKQTQKRLSKLEERRYLTCLTRRPQKHVYTIGRNGVPVLIEQGYAPHELALKRLRSNELKELGIKHAMFIADIHVKLLQLVNQRSLSITNWVEGRTLWDTVTTSANVVIPIRPDAWFTIGSKEGKAHFFLEADRGSMAHSRMHEKISGYAAYFQQQRHVKKYEGMKTFRVATITENPWPRTRSDR
jgi:Replication-relaxation